MIGLVLGLALVLTGDQVSGPGNDPVEQAMQDAALSTLPASAEYPAFKTGNDLYLECASERVGNQIACLSDIAVVATTILGPGQSATACLRVEPTAQQLRYQMVKYLSEHPGMRKQAAAVVETVAFSRAFPCVAAPQGR